MVTDSTPIQISLRKHTRSSRRYKANMTDLAFDPAQILRLRPVWFEWKATGRTDVGLIAEDVWNSCLIWLHGKQAACA